MRGATKSNYMGDTLMSYISIHAPREGSDNHFCSWGQRKIISIHAPREGSDDLCVSAGVREKISIHAPREGSDWPAIHLGAAPAYFNPRSP